MAINVFLSYSHRDEVLRDQLAAHLKPLEYEGIIRPWYDRRIIAGKDLHAEIQSELELAQVILLLISSDFIASDYCWGKEMLRAMEKHEQGSACVVPIILRPVDWTSCPFGKLAALPRDGKPVTSWNNADEALVNVTKSLRVLAANLSVPALPAPNRQGRDDPTDSPPGVLGAPTESASISLTYSPPDLAILTWGSGARRFRFDLIIDGVRVADIRHGEMISCRVASGMHHVQLRRLWSKSNVLPLLINAGDQLSLEYRLAAYDGDSELRDRALALYGLGETYLIRRV
jgi:hypothetical protein